MAWLALVLCLVAPLPAHGAVELTRAELLLGETPAPPPDGAAGWEPVTLPDEWRTRRPEREGFAWYRLELPALAEPDPLYALYLPSLGMNAAAWVNGEPVGSGGSFTEPAARNFNRPLYFTFPRALLRESGNVVHVRLWCYATPHHGYLGPVLVGPDSDLRARYEAQLFRQVELAELSSWLTGLMVLFLLGLWIGSRFEGVYGWFVFSAACWFVNSLNYWVRDPPFTTWTWERVTNSGVEVFVAALVLWVHRFQGTPRPRVERGVLFYAAASFVATWLLPPAGFYPTVIWLHVGALGIGSYAVSEMMRHWRTYPAWQTAVYAVAGALGLSFATHDLGIQFGFVPATSPSLFPFVVPLLLFCNGATLVARFVGSLRAAENLSRELERRVGEKGAELERSHGRTRELERAQVLAHERERLMREMHDGLGGHLVSALSLVEAGDTPPAAVAAELRRALDEMRIVIDSLDPHIEDLGQLLGQLRARLEPVLRRSGLRLRWEVTQGAALPGLGPEQALHVLRILQEAITNVIKHARASEVCIATRLAPTGVTLTIEDDGCGLAEDRPSGRGLANMRSRARELGAELRVQAAARGSIVELELRATPPA